MDLINLSFAAPGKAALNALSLEYNYWLVFCSFLVAWMGAYAGLTIVISIQSSISHFAKTAWLLAGSVTLGCAVWSMHYIGMLAFTLPVPVHHHMGLTLVSIVPAILASFIALLQLSKKQKRRKSTLISGCFLGIGIGTMHYVGMAAMTGAFTLVYNPWIFALSILTAIGLALISLYSRNTLLLVSNSETLNRLFISAPIMGLAISGMHYTGMQAAIFLSDPGAQPMLHGLDHATLTIIAVALTVGLSLTATISTSVNAMFVRLYAALQAAEAASQAKANFLARMSHEIRTPMNAVIGMTRLALRTDITQKQAGYLNNINTASQNLLAIINDILDFSKIEAGKFELDQSDFSIDEVSRNIYDLFEHKANEKNIQLTVYIEKNVPARLHGDSLRLNQILINLVANAIKFTERGVVTITIDVKESGSNAVTLVCSVRDSGIGMSSEQIDHIFDSFNQADNTITRQFGGTGLGLAICKQLCELMHGRIWVESSPNLGTVFHFNLQMEQAHSQKGVKTLPQDMPLPNVLVVDDDPMALEVMSEMLISFGLKPQTALSAMRGLELLEQACLEQSPFQLVLVDWRMPGMDGVELVRAMQESQSIGVRPEVLIVSAHGREELWPAIKELGVLNYLIKPIQPSTLFDTINSIFGTDHSQSFEPLASKASNLSFEILERIAGTRVLLAEDNVFNQQIATETLESMGMVVDLAADGRECLSKLEQADYDLVLMDIQMPNMDGLTAAKEIRKRWPNLDLPIIAMTAHALPEDKTKSLRAGMNQHITKPFDPDELAMSIHYWLQPRAGAASNDVNASVKSACQSLASNEPSLRERRQTALTPGGSEATRRMLASFCDVYRPDKSSLQSLLNNNDFERAIFLAHGLKSAGTYLGNAQLSQYATQVEALLKKSTLPECKLINAFDTELQLTWQAAKRDLDQLASLKALSEPQNNEDNSDGTTNAHGFQNLLNILIKQLRDDDCQAESSAEVLLSLLGWSHEHSAARRLMEAISDTDYERALSEVDNVKELILQRETHQKNRTVS